MSKKTAEPVPPIVIGGFTLHPLGLTVKGRPSFGEYQGVGQFIQRAVKASGWWLADWLRYGDSRTDWRAQLSQAQDVTGLSEKTLRNVRAVGAIEASRRRDGVEFSVHAEVAALAPEEQSAFLEQAATEGLTQRELRRVVRSASRRHVVSGQAESMYTVEVSVRLTVEAGSPYAAEQAGWAKVKSAVASVAHAHVVGAHALPGAPLRKVKAS